MRAWNCNHDVPDTPISGKCPDLVPTPSPSAATLYTVLMHAGVRTRDATARSLMSMLRQAGGGLASAVQPSYGAVSLDSILEQRR
jgi:hypothetical protein